LQKDFRQKYWFEIILLVIIMGVHLYAATSDAYNFPSNWFTRDDAYYYFKVAQNVTEGRGLTFDGINVTNGYHPLWMLVNIPLFSLARYDLILPLRIMLLLQGLMSAATAILLYRIARAAISEPVGILLAAWWAFSPYIHGTMYEYGLETGLAAFVTAWLLYALFRFERSWRGAAPGLREISALAAIALLALLSRLDLVFLALLAGAWIILRGTHLRVLVLLDLLLAMVAVFASFTGRLGFPAYYNYTTAAIAMAAISAGSRLVLYFLLGLYQKPARSTALRPTGAGRHPTFLGRAIHALFQLMETGTPLAIMAKRIVAAVSLSTLVTAAAMIAATPLVGSFPRTALLIDWAINLAGMLALRGLWRLFSEASSADDIPSLVLLKCHWQAWTKEAVAYYATLGIPLSMYLLFNKLLVGMAMPVSGEIKRWWGTGSSNDYMSSARSGLEFWAADPASEFNAWKPFSDGLGSASRQLTGWLGGHGNETAYIGLLSLVGLLWLLVLLLRRRKAARAAMQTSLPLLLTTSGVQILSYNASGYASMKEWYWITEPMLVAMALATAIWILVQPLAKRHYARAGVWALIGLAGLGLALNFAALTHVRMPHGAQPVTGTYMDSVAFLEANTPPGSMIGMTGGGNVGYYIKDRTIVNMDGLINSPAYFEALKRQAGGQYMEAVGLDYIFANPTILAGTPYYGQYSTGRELGRFGGKSLMEFTP
jgi:hypothetical protein